MAATAIEEAHIADPIDEAEADVIDLGKEEQKHRFVMLRAKGIAMPGSVGIWGVSKGTLTAWNAELEAQIARTRAMELEALQEEFFLLKEGRIRLIGEQLKGEYVETGQRTKTGSKLNSGEIAEQLQSVPARYRGGEISEDQAEPEQAVLQSMLKAIEQTELAAKLERLEAVVRSER